MAIPSASITGITTGKTTAILQGEISLASPVVTSYGFYYSDSEPASAGSNSGYTLSSLYGGPFTVYVSGLTPNTEYFFQAYATNSEGSYTTETSSSTTTTAEPAVILKSVDVTNDSFTASGSVVTDGGSSITTYGFCYTLSTSATTITDDGMYITSGSSLPFYFTGSDLESDSVYRIRAFAINSNGIGYSPISTFTTTKIVDGLELYVKGLNDYYRLNCRYVPKSADYVEMYTNVDEIEGNIFEFILTPPSGTGSANKPSILTYDELFTNEEGTDFSGSEVYIKFDSPLNTYLNENVDDSSIAYSSYINTKQPYLYFGKLYPRDSATNKIMIDAFFMKDYVYKALPEVNQVDNLREFFGVAFDKLYQPQVYGKIRNILRLSDPLETKDEYLRYLLETYGTTSIVPSGNTDYDVERFFVRNISDLFKRKGTYESLSLLFKLITKTKNRLNVYEHWHSPLPCSGGTTEQPTVSAAPFYVISGGVLVSASSLYSSIEEYCIDNSYTFEEYSWRDNYSDTLSGSTGYWATTGARYFEKQTYPTYDSSLIMSPHYRVEMDVSTQPIDDENTEIFGELLQNIVFDKFSEFKPVSRFIYYSYLLGLNCDFAGNVYNTYEDVYDEYINTKCVKSVFESIEGTYISLNVSTTSTSFDVVHNLGTMYLLVQTYACPTPSYPFYKRMYPKEIIILNNNTVRIQLAVPQQCYIFIDTVNKEGDMINDLYDSHSYGLFPVTSIQKVSGSYRYEMQPMNLLIEEGSTPENEHDVSLLTSPTSSGMYYEVNLMATDYIAGWSSTGEHFEFITHNLGTPAIIMDVYKRVDGDTFEKVQPHDMIIVDSNHVIIHVTEDGTYGCVIRKLSDWSFLYTKEDLIGSITSVKFGYVNPSASEIEFVESCSPSGNNLWNDLGSDWYVVNDYDIDRQYPNDDYTTYNAKIIINIKQDKTINEIGLYDDNDELLFYTGSSPLYLKQNTKLVLYYTIRNITVSI